MIDFKSRLLSITLAILCLNPAHAQDVEVELVLLADASGSIDQAEIAFQRRGYAEAITDPAVVRVIEGSAYGRIAVTYVEWAANQAVVADWAVIDGAESAAAFAEAILAPPRRAFGRNAIGAALLEGKRLIDENAHDGWRRVIDFSGDSANNFSGPSIAEAREAVLAAGIVINGLAIACPLPCSGQPRPGLRDAYERQIMGGPGAFVVVADGTTTFADAVRRKLILEIGGLRPARRHAAR
ncbi:DUF1194 domain-containing protein [Rhodobacteraceae bacterium CCMM004]|nr:DUF1194 domain-containing protein [Rhodobacteraceae bacterium CCMM004]